MADEKKTQSGFTEGETKIVMCCIKHLRGTIDTDFDAVAKELGYKDGSVVKTRWRQIHGKKITGTYATAKTPTKGTPKKRAASTPAEGINDEGDDAETPSRKKKGRTGKKVKDEEATNGEDGEGEKAVVKAEDAEDDDLA